ncbi:MAG: phosphoglycerate mutase [Rhodobacterales bacterium]|nr:MAG: phosphoglycerate mutase [Rhodobacterales bacterium]
MTYPPLYLLRHGQTDWNRERRIQGQRESTLTRLGESHAKAQAGILVRLGLPAGMRCYSSPQKRTRQTAELALGPLGITPRFDDRLKEVCLGAWEGQLYADVMASDPARFENMGIVAFCLSSPGETEAAMRDRVGRFLDELAGPALIVSHGITLTILRAIVLGLDLEQMEKQDRSQGTVSILRNGIETRHAE